MFNYNNDSYFIIEKKISIVTVVVCSFINEAFYNILLTKVIFDRNEICIDYSLNIVTNTEGFIINRIFFVLKEDYIGLFYCLRFFFDFDKVCFKKRLLIFFFLK